MFLNYFLQSLIILGMAISFFGIIVARLIHAPIIYYYAVFFGGAAISFIALVIALRICVCQDKPLKSCRIHHKYARD